jgi:hypothetical protein
LKTLPVHEPNDLYDTTFRLFTLQSPFGMGKTAHAFELLSDNRFVSLDAHFRYFRQKYDAILESHDQRRDMLASVRGTRTAGWSTSFTIISVRSTPRSNPCGLKFRRWSASRTGRSVTDEPAGLEISQDRKAGSRRH